MLKNIITACAAITMFAAPATADDFVDIVTEPFGEFSGVAYVRHSGVFEGESALGAFRVPFEVVAPADPLVGEKTLLFEPPHSLLNTWGLDVILGPQLIFERRLRYASVGVGNWSPLQILDPSVPGLVFAGEPFAPANPVNFPVGFIIDEEIIVRFVNALESDEAMLSRLGSIHRHYAFGLSETAAMLQNLMFAPGGMGEELFDLWFLHTSLWRPVFGIPGSGLFENLPDGSPTPVPYNHPDGVGRVMIVNTEGDTQISDAEFYQCAVDRADFRLYEIAGAAHTPTNAFIPFGNNRLDSNAVMRGVFAQGDDWLRLGALPPDSVLMDRDPTGPTDPGCFDPIGLLRDGDANALGGVRLPEIEVGQATYIASDPTIIIPIPGVFPGLFGNSIDLTCAVDENGEPRFKNHGDYVKPFVKQANALRKAGFLLDADAASLKEEADASNVGEPGSCE